MRLVPLSHEQLQPLEEVIRQKFIPVVSGKCSITNEERDLFALPIREGGMGIPLHHQLYTQQHCLHVSRNPCTNCQDGTATTRRVGLRPDV